MEPFTPNDPLWGLLGKGRLARPRPNFVQNVVRAARQTPQERGLMASLQAWWWHQKASPTGLAWAATAAIVVFVSVSWSLLPDSGLQVTEKNKQPVPDTAILTEADFLVPEFEAEWKNLEQMGDLLAVQDTSQMTDREIHMLLY